MLVATMSWRYLVPNLLTCVAIALGLAAISQATAGDYDAACWFSLWCVLLDKADGTAARLLKASSAFGVQMDSLSDLITFGIAPATILLAALAGNQPVLPVEPFAHYRYAVYAGAFAFAICSALRLAKFNVLTATYGKDYFFGIPTTVAGALVCAYYLTARKYELPWQAVAALPAIALALALAMVSRLPLPKLGLRRSLLLNIFQVANILGVYVFGILRLFPEYLLSVGLGYVAVGIPVGLIRGVKPPRPDSDPVPDPADEQAPA